MFKETLNKKWIESSGERKMLTSFCKSILLDAVKELKERVKKLNQFDIKQQYKDFYISRLDIK